MGQDTLIPGQWTSPGGRKSNPTLPTSDPTHTRTPSVTLTLRGKLVLLVPSVVGLRRDRRHGRVARW